MTMRSIDAVFPASGGIGIFVSGTTVVSAATGGSTVGWGVGAPGASDAVAVGAGDLVGLAVGAALVATATGDADGATAVPPHAVMRIATPMIARPPVRLVIRSSPPRCMEHTPRGPRGIAAYGRPNVSGRTP